MRKIVLLSVFVFAICNLLFTSPIKANGEFRTNVDVTYSVKDSGVTEVVNKFTVTNVLSNLYATSYTMVLDSIHPENIKSYDANGPLSFETNTKDSKTTISINFNDTVVGKDKSRTFWISYNEASFAVKTGEIWEISIPKLSENSSFDNFNLNLLVSEKMGGEAYIFPEPKDKYISNGFIQYKFNKDDITKTGVVAGFGEFQVFSFTLNYHLENPLNNKSQTEITLPPDTSFQRVYYQDIVPRPDNISIDIDGNWIALYNLKPRERIDVVATGNVQIFSSLRPFLVPNDSSLSNSLKPDIYWESDSPQIVSLASKLKTPKAIYDYVSNLLKYNVKRVGPNVERLGAIGSLNDSSNAICMEYTDLFIAIARAAGIPAREINGYAYTENPDIQPLSLVNDVLHAWPEYYDSQKKSWIPIDPTWGSTTNGIDYFNKLDLRHFTFVIHGNNSKSPYPAGSYKLGSNPQKDVFVSFGKLPSETINNLSLSAKLLGWIPLISNKIEYEIVNNGPVALYNLKPKIFFDNKEVDSEFSIAYFLPFTKNKSYIDIPFSFLAAKTPNFVKIVVANQEIVVKTSKKEILTYNLLFVFIVTIVVIVSILFKLKKWKLPKINGLKVREFIHFGKMKRESTSEKQ